MTVVIADSSPLNYLTLIGSVDVLYRLYGTVIVPQQVIAELIDPAAPDEVRGWASRLPDWINVRVAVVKDDDMTHLDPGERAAIALALSEPGALLLVSQGVKVWHAEWELRPGDSLRRKIEEGIEGASHLSGFPRRR